MVLEHALPDTTGGRTPADLGMEGSTLGGLRSPLRPSEGSRRGLVRNESSYQVPSHRARRTAGCSSSLAAAPG